MPTESSYVFQEIVDMLRSSTFDFDGMPVSCLETHYKEKFGRSLDYNSLGVETIEELLDKMCLEGVVVFFEHPESNETCVRYPERKDKYSSEIQDTPMDVYDKIQYIVASYSQSTTISWIEKSYHSDFEISLDYDSLGVKDFKELIRKMHDKGRVLVYEETESKETYVMCAWVGESLRKFLKIRVEKLLHRHGGKIPLSRFEALYKDAFNLKLYYHRFGLTGLDHLCQVLNLGLADSQGEKVIKAGKNYNLRKRKRNG